ncbi:MAG: N-6 DNA methylase [Elusimicrobiota bacterium]
MDFRKEYNRESFTNFLHHQFLSDDFTPPTKPEEIPIETSATKKINKIFYLGESQKLGIKVYEIHHESENDPRVTLSRETFRIMANFGARKSLVSYVSSKSPNYRFSLITIDLKMEGAKVTKEYSNPRRYSFFLGPDSKTHTSYEYLINKGRIKDFDDLKNRFSIEVVNKEFYKKIAQKFYNIIGSPNAEKNKKEQVIILPDNSEKAKKDFAVRLIGRLVFCWFLKKKHSDKNIPLISNEVLSSEAVEREKQYYKNVLEPLFFEVLNTDINNRKEQYKNNKPWNYIPFLNGGLFTPLLNDFYGQNNKKISNQWITEVFQVFETYNFTIDENTPIDIEVAIDPEMLGRIFENLLAEINPVTGETARKSTGSYYTPRPIVEYMVDQSVKQYLINSTNIEKQKIDSLLSYHEEITFSETEKEQVVEALDKIKIVDPACGSGAFPMGILQKMLLVLQKVDPDSQKWLNKKLSQIDDKILKTDLEKKLKSENFNYAHKLGIIQNSIYGVDIQPIAVEIARLRFFLSLIVDEKIDDNMDNRGVEPLPNLDYKIMQGNSLLEEYEGIKLFDNKLLNLPAKIDETKIKELEKKKKKVEKSVLEFYQKNPLWNKPKAKDKPVELLKLEKELEQFRGVIEYEKGLSNKTSPASGQNMLNFSDSQSSLQLWQQIQMMHNEFFKTKKSDEKQRIQQEIENLNWQFIEASLREHGKESKLKELKKFQEKGENPYFLWKLHFAEVFQQGGFDIVIGNPPYVQMQKDEGKLASELKNQNYQTFERTGDVYAIFYEQGLAILKENGIETFITSSQWIKANYGKSLRKFFLSKNPLKIIALGPGVFESATVDTNILIAQNTKNKKQLVGSIVSEAEQLHDLNNLVFQPMSYVTEDAWAILNSAKQSIDEKIKANGKPLSEWEINIYRGVLTGYNEAFIIDEAKRKELIKADTKSDEIIKPVLRGREIEKYFTEWDGGYLINTHNGIKSKSIPPIQVNKYPAIKKHLDFYSKEITTRVDQGITLYNLRNCAYLDEFSKEKIIWKRIGSRLCFSYSDKAIYCLDSTCIATGEKIKYLTALLNSKLCNYQLFENAPKTGMGDLIISVQALEHLLVHYPNEKEEKKIVSIVDKILAITKSSDYLENPVKKEEVKEYECQIDQMVYKLYGLTEEEIKIVEK